MPSIFRLVLAVVLGVVISTMFIGLVDLLNHSLYPSPISNPTIHEQAELMAHSPFTKRLLVLLGYIISAFCGAYVAARIAPLKHKMISALFVGFFLLLCGIVFFIILPQPWWVSIASGVSFLLFAYLGGLLALK